MRKGLMRIHCTLSHFRLKLENITPYSWMPFLSPLCSLNSLCIVGLFIVVTPFTYFCHCISGDFHLLLAILNSSISGMSQ